MPLPDPIRLCPHSGLMMGLLAAGAPKAFAHIVVLKKNRAGFFQHTKARIGSARPG